MTKVQHLTPTARHDFSPDEIGALEDRFDEFNSGCTGRWDARQLGFEVKAGTRLVGAIAGWTWAGVCELRQLWIDQEFRHSGLGKRLLNSAIAEARSRGCSYVYLATYSFQAPTFYLKFGFKPMAVIADKPLGHSDIIMRLSLIDGAESCAGAKPVHASARV